MLPADSQLLARPRLVLVDHLFNVLKQCRNETVCHAAARALGKIGGARAVESLLAVFEDPPVLAVAKALVQIGDEHTVEGLAKELRKGDVQLPDGSDAWIQGCPEKF